MFRSKNKGIILVLVGALVALFACAELILFSVLKYRFKNMESWVFGLRAYYLLESTCSVALVDIGQGHIGSHSGQWVERDVVIPVGDNSYNTHYKISSSSGTWIVTSDIKLGERTYFLRKGGIRAFPIFIRGKM
ncbi:MAG: hypothetical protein V1662_05655 [Candidatus Omnitrophota bacterium]